MHSLEIDFYFNGAIELFIPHRYMNKVSGLCGNYNGEMEDDHASRNGKVINQNEIISLEHLARSWHHNGLPSSELHTQQCVEGDYQLIADIRAQSTDEEKRICSILYKFFTCNKVISPEPYHDACLADITSSRYKRSLNTHCSAVEAYVAKCKLNGIDIPNWRTKTACHVPCPMSHVWEETTTMSSGICGNLIGSIDLGYER